MSEKKVALRWSQHPLISAMLWILGTEGTETPDSQASTTTTSQNKVNNVAWKDQHGGNIHEYFTQVQSVENKDNKSSSSMEKESSSSMNNGNNASSTGGGTQLYPRTFYAQERNNNSDVYHGLNNNHHHYHHHPSPPEYRSNSKDISYGDLVDESPQWGFYVPITPPQSEAYAAMAKEISHAHPHKTLR